MISIKNLSKSFKLYAKPSDRIKEVFFRRSLHTVHQALNDVSFDLAPGETLGILGQNGAGKSTLLKILSGVLLPDSGSFHLDGRITGLLELGTGFDAELTGRANLLTNGLLIGMSAEEVAQQEKNILDFAELGRFIDEPLRTYSSGMVMRLAFAIAIHAQPRCFLVDEALSVGDGHFQQKCIKKIRQFRDQGGSIIFVSHDLNAIKQICDRALVLEGGQLVYEGEAEGAVNVYNRIMARLDEETADYEAQQRQQHAFGTGEAKIQDAQLVGAESQANLLACGELAQLNVTYSQQEPLPNLVLGFMIRDRFGQDIYGSNTYYQEIELLDASQEAVQVSLSFPMNLAPGKYTLTLALHGNEHHLEECYHWVDNYLTFEVAGSQLPPFAGLISLPTQVSQAYVPSTSSAREQK